MTLLDEIKNAAGDLWKDWSVVKQQDSSMDVPDPKDMGYQDAKRVNATFLYTDLQDSSRLAKLAKQQIAASVFASYLKTVVRVMRDSDGAVRSFDGDRVMAIYAGPNQEDRAVRAAMTIAWAVDVVLNEKVHGRFPELNGWNLSTMSGVATAETLLVRAGIRNNSDLLSVGIAPNLAAKLSDVRGLGNQTIAIDEDTYRALNEIYRVHGTANMWSQIRHLMIGGGSYMYRTTSYHWFLE